MGMRLEVMIMKGRTGRMILRLLVLILLSSLVSRPPVSVFAESPVNFLMELSGTPVLEASAKALPLHLLRRHPVIPFRGEPFGRWTPPPPPVIYALGDRGQGVKALQLRLVAYGYPLSPDGDFGPLTQWAVRDVQKRQAFPLTGIADDKLLKLLAKEPGEVTRFPGPVFSTPLAKGSSGAEVLTLQIYLNRFNYRLNLDSIFGSATLWALKDFQLRNGLSITGTADEKTCAKLLLAPTSKTWYTGSRPETVVTASAAESFVNRKGLQSPTPFLLWIDTSIPRLYLFQGEAGQWTLLKNFAVTVGKPSTPTIKGTFSVKKKGLSFIVPDHEDWMCKYYTQFYGDYLMHSIVYDLEGHVVDGRLGKYLSKGCVRMATANAKYIYDNIPYGTTVYVN